MFHNDLSITFLSNNPITNLSELFTELFLCYAPNNDDEYTVNDFLTAVGLSKYITTDNFYDILQSKAFLDNSLCKLIQLISPIHVNRLQIARYNKHRITDGYTIVADDAIYVEIQQLQTDKTAKATRRYRQTQYAKHVKRMENDPEYREKVNASYRVKNLSFARLIKRRNYMKNWMTSYRRNLSPIELREHYDKRNAVRNKKRAEDTEWRENDNAKRRIENLNPEQLVTRRKQTDGRWQRMTPKQKKQYYANRKVRNSKMPRDKKDIRNEKQRTYRENMPTDQRAAQIKRTTSRKRFRENTHKKILPLLAAIIQSKTR